VLDEKIGWWDEKRGKRVKRLRKVKKESEFFFKKHD
jgi:hypothetical protein